jgi:hypothetical protein
MMNLADAKAKLGNSEECLKVLEEVKGKSFFRVEIPLKLLRHLTSLYRIKIIHLIEIRTRLYRTEEHPEVANTLNNIANVLKYLGKPERAFEINQRVLGTLSHNGF